MIAHGKLDRHSAIAWMVIFASFSGYLVYKLHDFTEPFAYGHARWSDAYVYIWGMMHLDLGLANTMGANIEGVTDDGSLIIYRSVGPLQGLAQALFLSLFDREPWSVRILPLIANFVSLGLLMWLASRWLGVKSLVFLVLFYLGMPFLIKYGTSNEGFLAFTITLGLTGWVQYQSFLDDGRLSRLYAAIFLFAFGMGFSWHAGAMGLPIYLHLLSLNRPMMWKLRHATAFASLMLGSILILLVHQGIITGDYLYPLRRAMERAGSLSLDGSEFSWLDLARVQIKRSWDYFGPAVIVLSCYWFVRRLSLRNQRHKADIWIFALLLTGVPYGILLRQAAFLHDYLLLGFVPGFALAATTGALLLIDDGKQLFSLHGKLLRFTGFFIVALLLLGHGLLAARSAWIFEKKEANDLDGGEASIPFFLLDNLHDDTILAGDPSSCFHKVESENGSQYCVMRPHLAYLTRRPVRFVENNEELEALLQEAKLSHRGAILVHLRYGHLSKKVEVPLDWVQRSREFRNDATVYLWDYE